MYLVNSRLFKNPQLTIDHLEVEILKKKKTLILNY